MSASGLIFDRVVAGVDGSHESVEACRQAARLVEPSGLLALVSVFDPAPAVRTGWNSPRVREELEGTAQAALELGRRVVGDVGQAALINGDPARSLLRELARLDATLAVIGACGHSRVSQMILGSVAWELLRRAPCSVLIARPPAGGRSFPEEIVVVLDDSPCSEPALSAARILEGRFRASVRVVVSARAEVTPAHERSHALLDASAGADLVIVGRRGVGASNRGPLLQRATSSVLVVR